MTLKEVNLGAHRLSKFQLNLWGPIEGGAGKCYFLKHFKYGYYRVIDFRSLEYPLCMYTNNTNNTTNNNNKFS